MADVTYTIEAIDKSTSVMRNISSAITGLNQGVQFLNQAYRTSQQVINATVGEYVKYANQVRTITQVTGQSAEAVSKMIQVADDYKISTEQLTLAMKKMAGEGISLTTDSLAKMSDEYLKLEAGVGRQQYLTEKFGRSGIAFAEIMLAGGDAIRSQSDAISKNLILTDASVKRARDYEKALDDLNDSVYGLKVSLGQSLLPILTASINQIKIGTLAWANMDDQLLEFTFNLDRAYPAIFGATRAMEVWASAALGGTRMLQSQTEGLDSATLSYMGMAEQLENAARLQGMLSEETGDYTSVLTGLSGSLAEAAFNQLEMNIYSEEGFTPEAQRKALDYAFAMGLIDSSTYSAKLQILGLNTALLTLPSGVSVDVIMNILSNLGNANWNPMAAVSGGDYPPPSTTSGSGNPMWIPDPANPGHYMLNPARRATGGAVSGRYAITGDSVSGKPTGYEELVDFQAKRVYSAPQTRAMGAVPGYAGGSGGEMELSQATINRLAEALSFKLQPYL